MRTLLQSIIDKWMSCIKTIVKKKYQDTQAFQETPNPAVDPIPSNKIRKKTKTSKLSRKLCLKICLRVLF
jgi:hypothetical protein